MGITIQWMMEQLIIDMTETEERVDPTEEEEWADQLNQAALDGMIYLLMKWMERSGIDHSVMNDIGQSVGPEYLAMISKAQSDHINRVLKTV